METTNLNLNNGGRGHGDLNELELSKDLKNISVEVFFIHFFPSFLIFIEIIVTRYNVFLIISGFYVINCFP